MIVGIFNHFQDFFNGMNFIGPLTVITNITLYTMKTILEHISNEYFSIPFNFAYLLLLNCTKQSVKQVNNHR